jgi:hypothetical protein
VSGLSPLLILSSPESRTLLVEPDPPHEETTMPVLDRQPPTRLGGFKAS